MTQLPRNKGSLYWAYNSIQTINACQIPDANTETIVVVGTILVLLRQEIEMHG